MAHNAATENWKKKSLVLLDHHRTHKIVEVMTFWWVNGERVAQTTRTRSLQFHNCGIIDDDIWFYYRISLYFMSFLPSISFMKMPADENHLKLLHVSIFKLYCHLTMSHYWYYQYFINIIFIPLEELNEGHNKLWRCECQWRNERQQSERDVS